jgi:hypothetical protein
MAIDKVLTVFAKRRLDQSPEFRAYAHLLAFSGRWTA